MLRLCRGSLAGVPGSTGGMGIKGVLRGISWYQSRDLRTLMDETGSVVLVA